MDILSHIFVVNAVDLLMRIDLFFLLFPAENVNLQFVMIVTCRLTDLTQSLPPLEIIMFLTR